MEIHQSFLIVLLVKIVVENSCQQVPNDISATSNLDSHKVYARHHGNKVKKLPAQPVKAPRVRNQKAISGKDYSWGKCKRKNRIEKNCNKDIYQYGCHQSINRRANAASCWASFDQNATTVLLYQVYANAARTSTSIQCSSVTDSDFWQSQTNLKLGGNSELLYLVYDSYASSGYFSLSSRVRSGFVMGYRLLRSRTNYNYYVATSTDGKRWTQQTCEDGCPQLRLYNRTQVYRSVTLNLWIGIEVYRSKYYLTTSPNLRTWTRRAQVLLTEVAGFGWVEMIITQFVILQEGVSVEESLYCFLATRPGSAMVKYYIGSIQNGNFTVQFGPRLMDYGPDGGFYTFADETYVQDGVTVTDIVLYSSIKNAYFTTDGYEEFLGTPRYVKGNYHCPAFPLRQYSKTDFDQVIGTEKTIYRTSVGDGVNVFKGLAGRTFSAHVVVIRETARQVQFGVHGDSAGRSTNFGYDNDNQAFYIDRTRSPYPSGQDFAKGLVAYTNKYSFALTLVQEILALFIIVDENTVEIGYDNGNVWVTALSFSQPNNILVSLTPVQGTFILQTAEMKFFTK